MGLGFKRRASTGSMFAAADIISNFHDRLGRAHSVAQDEFTLLSMQLKPGTAMSLVGIGWVPIEHGRQTELQRYLRRRLFLNESAHAARLLGQEIRRVAATLGPEGAVGKGLLACCIPRGYVLHGGIPGGGIDLQTLGCGYVAASGIDQVSVLPAMAVKGFPVLLGEVRFEIPPPADGSDPYHEWRHELPLSDKRSDRQLP